MKYAIWRHENALGNSAEQTVGLARYIKEVNDENPEVWVEMDFQKYMAMCIPGVKPENVHFFEKGSVEKREQMVDFSWCLFQKVHRLQGNN